MRRREILSVSLLFLFFVFTIKKIFLPLHKDMDGMGIYPVHPDFAVVGLGILPNAENKYVSNDRFEFLNSQECHF